MSFSSVFIPRVAFKFVSRNLARGKRRSYSYEGNYHPPVNSVQLDNKRASGILSVLVTAACLVIFAGHSACYFPVELHGTFLMQTQATSAFGGSVVSYSEITVEVDAIPPWGRCHRRRGHHVILKDRSARTLILFALDIHPPRH